jgi:hypothetical protein
VTISKTKELISRASDEKADVARNRGKIVCSFKSIKKLEQKLPGVASEGPSDRIPKKIREPITKNKRKRELHRLLKPIAPPKPKNQKKHSRLHKKRVLWKKIGVTIKELENKPVSDEKRNIDRK